MGLSLALISCFLSSGVFTGMGRARWTWGAETGCSPPWWRLSRAKAGLQIDAGRNYCSCSWFSIIHLSLLHSKRVWLVIIQSNHFLITLESSDLPKCHLTKCCAQREEKCANYPYKRKQPNSPNSPCSKAFSCFCASSADSFSFQGLFFLYILVQRKRKSSFPLQRVIYKYRFQNSAL